MRRFTTLGLMGAFGLLAGLTGCEPTTPTETPAPEAGVSASPDPAPAATEGMTPVEPTPAPAGEAAPEVTPPAEETKATP